MLSEERVASWGEHQQDVQGSVAKSIGIYAAPLNSQSAEGARGRC
jgi:hypothetical protein